MFQQNDKTGESFDSMMNAHLLNQQHRLSKMDPFYGEQIINVLIDSLLFRKVIHEGTHSLLRAFCSHHYFTSQYYRDIEQMLFKYVNTHSHNIHNSHQNNQNYINNTYNKKLAWFLQNNYLIKDYLKNPMEGQNEKITLEILSEIFQQRIVIYTISNDNLLQSIIINNKFKQKTHLIKIGNHYDVIYKYKKFEKIVIAQILINEIINEKIIKEDQNYINNTGNLFQSNNPHYNYLENNFKNIEYELWKDFVLDSRKYSNKFSISLQPGRTRHHKKSLSDNYNVQIDNNDNGNHRLYNMFSQIQPTKEFMQIFNDIRHKRLNDNEEKNELEVQEEKKIININDEQSQTLQQQSDQYNNPEPLNQFEYQPEPSLIKQELLFDQNNNIVITNPHNYCDFNQQNNINNLYFSQQYIQMLKTLQKQQQVYSNNDNYIQENHNNNSNNNINNIINKNSNFNQINHINFNQSDQDEDNVEIQQKYYNKNKKRVSQNSKNSSKKNVQSNDQSYKRGSSDLDSSLKHEKDFNEKNKKLVIIDEGQTRYTGRLKFFDEQKNYGFIVMDEDQSDIFVHFDDIAKANIGKEYLRTTKYGNVINFSFSCMTYIGKYDRSRKAVDLMLQQPQHLNYNQIIMNNVNMFLNNQTINPQ